MPPYEDEQFQEYLKSFQPLSADPLPVLAETRRKQHSVLTLAAAAAMIVLVVVAGIRDWKSAEVPRPPVAIRAPDPQLKLLTLARANALLSRSQSFKASLDEIATNSARLKLSEGQQSALAVLGKEKKL